MHLTTVLFEAVTCAIAGLNPSLSAEEKASLKARLATLRASLSSVPAAELAPHGLSASDIQSLRAALTATGGSL